MVPAWEDAEMSEEDQLWLREDIGRFSGLLPMDRDDYLAFLAAIQEAYLVAGPGSTC